ncbi:IS4 family transposase [Solwaraspora sp. WMMD1047]|uniref:IS4 family transposase n=1 Tax=Solwaraspora sp. WMMD1047 TaxID=3016102 RepID=UPI0024175510|nr:IS4 family transposase [Solwaraspora sp. WMMD1047]MDG4827811.1 IS4 family transposase [Solwaraspora sp. WMMD1047]MDG4828655.1 IS4 family transposase [Solwaraspora sp. WMMD1047]MDG4828994.1 IS4 family transposase [Solwaraspora sp. WMMD1047]MDG4833324.1 IS4 family transposase [Solwaraspora sp. WMMD1047]MDG4833389.1 IS4 family transposase [Solwaraspora sp. WMMD1047]
MDALPRLGAGAAWQHIGLGVLSQSVPRELIDEAVAATGVTQRRVRLLPARVVVLFVLAMCLFSTDGYRQVWRLLVSGWPALARITPTTSAFSQARQRLGEAPLRYLFERVAGARGEPGMPGVFVAGRRVVAWDGTKLQTADSPANEAAFGRDAGGGGNTAGYPRLWLLTLIECGTHAVIGASFGREAEMVQARALLPLLREDMLLVADRNFHGYDLWRAAEATGAGLLWRMKSNRHLPVVRALPDGSWISVIKPPPGRRRGTEPVITVRVIEYTVTVATTNRHGVTACRTERYRLVTNLLCPQDITAGQLIDCYHQRWETENSYQNLKTHQRGSKVVLRSHDPTGVRQEMWAHLIVYQALRDLITTTAAEHHLDPDRLPFLTCLRLARRHVINTAITTSRDLTSALITVADELLDDQTGPRRSRSSPRAVKRPTSPYRGKKRTEPASTTATYTTNLTKPGPEST